MQNPSLIESVGIQELKKIIQFRVKVGADLLEAITEVVRTQEIRAGIVVSGIGLLNKAVFRNLISIPKKYPVNDDIRIYKDLEAPFELVSLGGWIAPRADGTPEIHCHFSASTVQDDTVVTLGGHLTPGTIAGVKVAVAIAVVEAGASRTSYDEATKSLEIFF